MTPSELSERSAAMYGVDWQSTLARRIAVDARTVRRWKAGDREIPQWVGVVLELLERHPEER